MYMEYDIAIIGGGPAGYTAAERASENGLKTILFEKNAIGGVCLNEGCIPTKTLLYSAKILDSIKSASKYGLAIIGGGVIGMEFASFFNSMGVKVKVIEMLPEILGNMDKETSAMLRSEYKKKGVEFFLNTKVTEVSAEKVFVEKNGKADTIEADKILVSVGRRPITKSLGLENLAIEIQGAGVKVNEHMLTSHPHVYAAGDITGFSLLAHTAYREAEVAIHHILGIPDEMSYKAIPAVVYTNPELASVGKTEEELVANGESFRVQKIPMTYSGRFVAENENGNGLCKLITDDEDRIIGCHLLGNPASEIIVTAGIAVENGYTVDEFKKNIFPHPTVSEILHESLYI